MKRMHPPNKRVLEVKGRVVVVTKTKKRLGGPRSLKDKLLVK
jgi:hypothetical protein